MVLHFVEICKMHLSLFWNYNSTQNYFASAMGLHLPKKAKEKKKVICRMEAGLHRRI